MGELTGSVSAVSAPERTSLDDLTAQTAAEAGNANLLSQISDVALESVTKYPGHVEKEQALKAEILRETGDNAFLTEAAQPKEPTALSDDFITKISGLYNEVTVYQVAWNMAKRTGRDVETLLKAQ